MLKVNRLSVSYSNNLVLEQVSFSLKKASIFGILGPNGSGKSTLLKAILNIIPRQEGSVSWEGIDIRKDVAYVPQLSEYDWDFPISVFELVLNALVTPANFWKLDSQLNRNKVTEVLNQLGLAALANNPISDLSGGQKQKLLLARAFVRDPKILILDEPFNAIDHISEKSIVQTLRTFASQGNTVLMVHHNLNSVKEYFDEILLLNKSVVASGKVDTVFKKKNLEKLYGDNLFANI